MSHLKTDQNNHAEVVLSVIICCSDRGDFILEAISSIQSCQEEFYEIIIVNEEANDSLTQTVLNYLKDRGYPIIDTRDRNVANARNIAIEKANGKYILPLEPANKIRGDFIAKAIDILDRNPAIGVVYGHAEFFGEKTGILEVPDFDINILVRENYIDGCAIFRKVAWQECGGYDPKLTNEWGYLDWDFWLGVAEKSWKFERIPEVLFDYRLTADAIAARRQVNEARQQQIRYIVTKHLQLYTTNFAIIFAEKECQILKEKKSFENLHLKWQKTEADLEHWKSQLQHAQADVFQSQTKLEKTKAELVYSQNQLLKFQSAHKQTNSALEQTHVELARIYAAHDRTFLAHKQTCEELAQIHTAHQQTCEELAQIHTAHDRACEELAQLHTAHDRTCQELGQAYTLVERTQEVLEQTQEVLEQTRNQLDRTKAELAHSQTREQQIQQALNQSGDRLAAIQSSKFWKMRLFWFKIKRMLKLAADEV